MMNTGSSSCIFLLVILSISLCYGDSRVLMGPSREIESGAGREQIKRGKRAADPLGKR